MHKWQDGAYKIIGFNPYIFWSGGGSADCLIGDCDNDGNIELIMSGGPFRFWSRTPEIVVFKWNGWRLVKTAIYDDPVTRGYVYMVGIGDVDNDGVNEVCVGTNVVHILQWNGAGFDEEAVLPTWGGLAVTNIGDRDNDGFNEINVGNVWIYPGEKYMSWVFKYGWIE